VTAQLEFDLSTALADGLAGQALALGAPSIDAWRAEARRVIARLAAARQPFTADDVLADVGLPHPAGMNVNNAVGALFTAARCRKLIVPDGRVPSQRASNNGRYVTRWIGTSLPLQPGFDHATWRVAA